MTSALSFESRPASPTETRSYTSPRGGSPHGSLNLVSTVARPSSSASTWSASVSQHSPITDSPEREWTLFGQLMENEWPAANVSPKGTKLRQRHLESATTPPEAGSSRHDDPSNDLLLSTNSSVRLFESTTTAEQAPLNHEPLRHHVGGEQYDSEDSELSSEDEPPVQENISRHFQWLHMPTIPILWKNVLKCSLAYLIASLFTFMPILSGFLADIPSKGNWEGPSPSGHIVATVVLYFNPAKTIGGMVEADIYVLFGLAYTSFVCLASMSMFWFLEVRPGWEWLADVLILTWIASAMIVVAWLKVWMNRPSFNTACSMMCIILFVVIVKEGGWDTLLQISFNVCVGAVISNVISLSLWAQSATKNLQDDMDATLDSFAMLLQMLTRTFLLDPDFHPKQSKLHRAVEAHQKSFTSLKRNLTEAHSEWLCWPLRKGANSAPYDDAVDALNRLAQHLGGMRSGTRLQADLTRAHREGKLVLNQGGANAKLPVPDGGTREGDHGDTTLPGSQKKPMWNQKAQDEEDNAILAAAATVFGDLLDDLGSPVDALSVKCTSALKDMKRAFERQRRGDLMDAQEFYQIAEGIERALFTFDSTSNHAMMRLYQRSDSTDRGVTSVAANGDNETVFLVYFFVFTLQEFAKELVALIDVMSRICALERQAAAKPRLLHWIRNRLSCLRSRNGLSETKARPNLRRQFSTLVPIEYPRRKVVQFPKVRPHAPNTMQTPSRSSLSSYGRLKQSFWALGKRVVEPDLKYAFKAGVATAILAAPAFFDATRPIFIDFRGEWALLSFFVVMSPTIGATNFASLRRVGSTLLGASTASIVYLAFHDQPVVLAIVGFLYSIPCFYYILSLPQYSTSIRLILLTYNLTCLYCYNARYENLSVVDVAYHRAVAVTAGVIWAFVISQFWWPAEARRELGKALSEFCLNLGWLYTRLVMNYSTPPESLLRVEPQEEATITTPLLNGTKRSALTDRASAQLTSSIHDFMAMELHLQLKLINLQGLLAQTQHEPRLKGPFPVKLYRSILTSLQTILDNMHSMRCVTTREEWFTTVRRNFILPVTKERREMVGNVILYFSTLSSALRLKAPLPPYLPPAEKSRQELVRAIRNLEIVRARDVKGSRQLLYFAYALMMKRVIQELDFLGRTLQDAFGVLGGDTQSFETLFKAEAIAAEEDAMAGF